MSTPQTTARANEYPLISIAMCTYNGERFLREQMDSLVAQDYPNLEIIITDDVSTDQTPSILEEYEKAHPHITVYRNEKNLGFAKNFEKAISLCNGEYISLCDQDDIWFPEKTRILYENIGNASLIYSKTEVINEHGNKVNRRFPRGNRIEGKCAPGLLFGNCITGHLCLITREIAEKARPIPNDISHDHWLGFVAAETNGIIALDKVLSLYRIHDANAMLGSRKQKGFKALKRWRRYKKRLRKLKVLSSYPLISESTRELLLKIISAYEKYPKTFINKEMQNILNKYSDEILCLYHDKKKAKKNLSRGFLREMV